MIAVEAVTWYAGIPDPLSRAASKDIQKEKRRIRQRMHDQRRHDNPIHRIPNPRRREDPLELQENTCFRETRRDCVTDEAVAPAARALDCRGLWHVPGVSCDAVQGVGACECCVGDESEVGEVGEGIV